MPRINSHGLIISIKLLNSVIISNTKQKYIIYIYINNFNILSRD